MLPTLIQDLAHQFRLFPGVGRKNSTKLALDVLNLSIEDFEKLQTLMQQMRSEVRFCQNCGFFAQGDLCNICLDKHRSDNLICVVETPVDVLSIEKGEVFRGRYFVLNHLISPLDNIFPENTKIFDLFSRRIPEVLKNSKNLELVLFFKNGFASESTTAYIKDYLTSQKLDSKITLTRLAQGLPLYFNPETLDSATISQALKDRRKLL